MKKIRLKSKASKMTKNKRKNRSIRRNRGEYAKHSELIPEILDKDVWSRINAYNQLELYNFMKAVENRKHD